MLILAASLYGLAVGIDGFSSTPGDLFETKPAESARDLPEPVLLQGTPTSAPDLGKDDENLVWESPPFPNKIQSEWTVRQGSQRLKVETTLDDSLQEYLTGKLDRKLSKQIAVVVMEPTTGRVLALAGHDRARPSNNPCLDSGFPAASIFKIVTASAAVEQHGFKPETVFVYSGQKHTLYKSQLKDKKSKYSRRITLRDSFAQSVNPVFGKLSVYHLEMSQIKDYARAFGFGEAIEFELGKPQSRLWVSEDSFSMAEIASGFNRKTTLSPCTAPSSPRPSSTAAASWRRPSSTGSPMGKAKRFTAENLHGSE